MVYRLPGLPPATGAHYGAFMSTEQSSTATRSEKVKNYLIGIGALTGLILGLLAQFKGEPVAEKTWHTLREQVNKQTESINGLYTQIEVLKAMQDARMSVELEHELEELRKQYDALASEKPPKKKPEKRSKGAAKPASKSLDETRLKRLESELETQQFIQDFVAEEMPEQRVLQALPKNLDEASKM